MRMVGGGCGVCGTLQVSRLAAANVTLTNSLQQAHMDLSAMLIERDELTAAAQSAEGRAVEMDTLMSQWLDADREWSRSKSAQLQQTLLDIASTRAAMEESLRTVGMTLYTDDKAQGA